MRIPIALVAVATLAPVLFLTGCGGANGLPASNSAPSTAAPSIAPVSANKPIPTAAPIPAPKTTSAPVSAATSAPVPAATSAPVPAAPITTDPRPAAPPSTGLVHVTTWKGVPAAKSVYVDSHKIVSYAPNGHVLGSWTLPGNLPSLIAGLTTAFGHSPLARVNGSAGWKYTWDGFVIYDDTPEVVGATDPAYQYDVTVSHVDGVLVDTVGHISVGTSGDAAAAIADVVWPTTGGAPFVAELDPYRLSSPAGGATLWTEVEGGATQHSPIEEIRGPVASWLS